MLVLLGKDLGGAREAGGARGLFPAGLLLAAPQRAA